MPSNHIMVKIGYTGCLCKPVSHGFFFMLTLVCVGGWVCVCVCVCGRNALKTK
jgi:hypothetical protein